MKCVHHPETEAEALCAICKAPVCGECRVTLREREYCWQCLEKKVNTAAPEVLNRDKSRALAFFLSLIPGVGYLYLGLMNRGLQTLILAFGTIFVAEMTRIDALIPLVLPVLLFYSIFDTLQLAGRMREGVPVEDKPLLEAKGRFNWQNYLGYALVGLGVLALLNNFLPYLFDYGLVHRLISPLLLMAIGVFILYQNWKKERRDANEGDT